MLHYLIELAAWMLLAYFAGCCIGCLLRQMFGSEPAVEAAPVTSPHAPSGASSPARLADLGTEDSGGKPSRPKGLSGARGGKPDNLQRLSGVGPKNEKILHSLGIFHFDQIGNWSAAEVNWVDDYLKFNGRIRREEWIRQARLLAEGKEAEFAKEFGTGGLRNKDGETESGTRTRKS